MSLLIGTVSAPNESGQVPGDRVLMCRFQSAASGDVKQIRIKLGETATVKVAIYADSSGEPGALLNAVNTAAAVTADTEASIEIAATAVVAGTYYWLAMAITEGQRYYYTSSSSGSRRHKVITFSSYNFPNPAGDDYYTSAYDSYIGGESDTVKVSGDNGSSGELPVLLSKEVTVNETGTGSDAGGIAVNKTSGDGGSGGESIGLEKPMTGSDAGNGTDLFKQLIRKAGADMKISVRQGHIGLPHKEVSL